MKSTIFTELQGNLTIGQAMVLYRLGLELEVDPREYLVRAVEKG